MVWVSYRRSRHRGLLPTISATTQAGVKSTEGASIRCCEGPTYFDPQDCDSTIDTTIACVTANSTTALKHKMYCSKCGSLEDKVVDSRLSKDGRSIRRRRECVTCTHRFTTYEEIERAELRVSKRDGSSEPFDRQKVLRGMMKACEKRPVSGQTLERVVEEIIQELECDFEREIPSNSSAPRRWSISMRWTRLLTSATPLSIGTFGISAISSTRFSRWSGALSEASFNKTCLNDFARRQVFHIWRKLPASDRNPQWQNLPPSSREHHTPMIALRDELPLIQFNDGEAVAFDRDWLVRSLVRAALQAGYPHWWLAEHVAESVTAYLRQQREATVLSVEQMADAVRSALRVIGYGEVADRFLPGKPKTRISLLELARGAGAGYELAFFELLGRRIQETIGEEGGEFELQGLDLCVKMLRGRKVWSRDCDALRDEIILFTREQTVLAAGRNEVAFTLA